jgi:hypothetical protein
MQREEVADLGRHAPRRALLRGLHRHFLWRGARQEIAATCARARSLQIDRGAIVEARSGSYRWCGLDVRAEGVLS